MISQSQIKDVLDYDPVTGRFTWLPRDVNIGGFNTKFAGTIAGTSHYVKHNGKRYIRIKLFGKTVEAHTIAYVYMTGEKPIQVDHINGDGTDNRWVNLRNVDISQNARNQRLRSDSSTGVSGVNWNRQRGKYMVRIHDIYLGMYSDFDSAVAVRRAAEIEHNYHPNHGTMRAL